MATGAEARVEENAVECSPLVDVHAHFVTESYVVAARAAGHTQPDGMPSWPSWSAEEHLRLMDEWNVSRSVLSISSPGVHFGDDGAARELARQVNQAATDVRHAHPDRFGHFASLPLPDVDGALAEAAYALDEFGSDGVAVETNTGGIYLGDERYDRLWAELDRRRAVVFVHPTSPPFAEKISLGWPRPMLEFIFDTTRAVSDLALNGVLHRWPDIRWVMPHGGGALPLIADRIEMMRTTLEAGDVDGPSVPDLLAGLWFDIAGTPFPNQVPALVGAFGSERVLYGSDYCWTPGPGVAAQIASIDQAQQPHSDSWRALTTRNAERLLGLR